MKKTSPVKTEIWFSREAIKVQRGKVLRENSIADRSWSSSKLFIMQSYTDNANGDAPLTVGNVWYFSFCFRSRCTHVRLETKTELLYNPTWHYMLKVNNRNTRTRYKICSKSRGNTTEQYHWRRSGALIVKFKCFTLSSIVLIVDLEHVIPARIVKIFFIVVK